VNVSSLLRPPATRSPSSSILLIEGLPASQVFVVRQYGVATTILGASPTADEGQSHRYTQKILLRAWRARDPVHCQGQGRPHPRACGGRYRPRSVAFGTCRLPNDAGLIFKVLGPRDRASESQVTRVLGRGTSGIIGTARQPPIFGASGSMVRRGNLQRLTSTRSRRQRWKRSWQGGKTSLRRQA